jgi:hypothetical protein
MERDLKGKQSVIVFDFDYTLTVAHMYHLIGGGHIIKWRQTLTREQILDNEDYIAEEIFGGNERLNLLKRRLSRLSITSDLVISSNNYLEHIKRALTKVGLLDYFGWIHARNGLYRPVAQNMTTGESYMEAGRKHEFIDRFLLPKYSCIVFIDDEMLDAYYFHFSSKKNVHLLAMRRGQKGIDANDFSRIESAIMECTQNKLLSSKEALCLQCKEREGSFYYEKHQASFCDPFCEREYVVNQK